MNAKNNYQTYEKSFFLCEKTTENLERWMIRWVWNEWKGIIRQKF